MKNQPSPHCPVCGSSMRWDDEDERHECTGPVQHCYTVEQEQGQQVLMLTASGSGEDAELFSTYPLVLPQETGAGAGATPNGEAPPCPVCNEALTWDGDDERFECVGMVQHCYTVEGAGAGRQLMLTASGSGEDAELFSTYPWPG